MLRRKALKLYFRAIYSDMASEFIEQVVDGFNTTIFAYGQTSSGEKNSYFERVFFHPNKC